MVLPLCAAIGFVAAAALAVGSPRGDWSVVRWTTLLVASCLITLACEPCARRLAMLATLFELDSVFPTKAPNRFGMLLLRGDIRVLQRQLASTPRDDRRDDLVAHRMLIASAIAALRRQHARGRDDLHLAARLIIAACATVLVIVGASTPPRRDREVAAPTSRTATPTRSVPPLPTPDAHPVVPDGEASPPIAIDGSASDASVTSHPSTPAPHTAPYAPFVGGGRAPARGPAPAVAQGPAVDARAPSAGIVDATSTAAATPTTVPIAVAANQVGVSVGSDQPAAGTDMITAPTTPAPAQPAALASSAGGDVTVSAAASGTSTPTTVDSGPLVDSSMRTEGQGAPEPSEAVRSASPDAVPQHATADDESPSSLEHPRSALRPDAPTDGGASTG